MGHSPAMETLRTGTAEYWEAKHDDALIKASQMRDPENRKAMLEIAEFCLTLAESIRRDRRRGHLN
jgi:hypothetical protein